MRSMWRNTVLPQALSRSVMGPAVSSAAWSTKTSGFSLSAQRRRPASFFTAGMTGYSSRS